MLPVQTFIHNLKHCLHAHHHHCLSSFRDKFITFCHHSSRLFLYYACKCLMILNKTVTYYSQNHSGTLGSSLPSSYLYTYHKLEICKPILKLMYNLVNCLLKIKIQSINWFNGFYRLNTPY